MTTSLTWDQALFSFRFENDIPAGKAKRKESLIQTFYQTSSAQFFDWLTFTESTSRNYLRKFFIRGKNALSLTGKIAFTFKFFQLK